MRDRTKRIWTINRVDLEDIVKRNQTLSGVLRELGYSSRGSSGQVLKKRMIEDGIDFSHIPTGYGATRGKYLVINKHSRSLTSILVEHSTVNNTVLKKRLIKESVLKEECSNCGVGAEWMGVHLSLQLDHINGINDDNRITNIRLLCPNCHSQTPTFGSKNWEKRPKEIFHCASCGKEIPRKTKTGMCHPCANKSVDRSQVKVDIDYKYLSGAVWEMPLKRIAEKYGVSDRTIRLRCRKMGIDIPPIGYWLMKERRDTQDNV